jgi:hypothetical protein
MYRRDLPGKTLSDIADDLNTNTIGWGGTTLGIRPHLTEAEPFFELESNSGANIQVPYTAQGLEQIATYTKIPTKFIERAGEVDKEFQQLIIERWLALNIDNVALSYAPGEGITEVYNPSQQRVEPRRILERAMNVMDTNAQVIELINTPERFRLDTVVAEGANFGWGGDNQVGDLTAGGIRIEQNREKNLAPSISEFYYRLWCTNGMEDRDEGLRIDIRGATVEQILAEVEQKAQEAFSRVETKIASYYELRNQPVEGDAALAVVRMADERGLPDRAAHALVTRLPEYTDEQGRATMFDMVNLFTNAANDPALVRRPDVRRRFELAGGAMVHEHSERCTHCQQRLN